MQKCPSIQRHTHRDVLHTHTLTRPYPNKQNTNRISLFLADKGATRALLGLATFQPPFTSRKALTWVLLHMQSFEATSLCASS